jgi:hypothetical protein
LLLNLFLIFADGAGSFSAPFGLRGKTLAIFSKSYGFLEFFVGVSRVMIGQVRVVEPQSARDAHDHFFNYETATAPARR